MKLHLCLCPELNSRDRGFHLYEVVKTEGYSDEDQATLFRLNCLRVFKALPDWIF